ncbi:MAG: GTP-binding protein [Candidatus Lokiarchaeota archaeon]|nr:GTP-binding protein [Candidatus Lokiarchaeota archaeon]
MVNLEEKLAELEDRLAKTIPNKATMRSICSLKAQIAKLKNRIQDKILTSSKISSKDGFDVKKQGDSSVALIGFPSVGKSTLLNKLTNAQSKIAAYEFTTLDAIPGLMEYKHAKIMVIDLPGIIKGASKGKGMGKRILSVAKTANLILIMLDIWNQPHIHLDIIEKELYDVGIRLDQFPPLISIYKTQQGGVALTTTVSPLNHIDEDLVKSIFNEFRIINALVTVHQDVTVDQVIDVLAGNRVYIPSLIICNKMDISTAEQEKFLEDLEKQGKRIIRISAETGLNLAELREEIYHKLRLINIFLKPKGKKADLIEPLVVPEDSTVADVARRLHRDFVDKFRYAFVSTAIKDKYGNLRTEGKKFKVGLKYILKDYDVLQINIRN